ncbi:unnamed protein product [Tenebrio molitor]|nr:unnamed protein product [Tenebrio molitor]
MLHAGPVYIEYSFTFTDFICACVRLVDLNCIITKKVIIVLAN